MSFLQTHGLQLVLCGWALAAIISQIPPLPPGAGFWLTWLYRSVQILGANLDKAARRSPMLGKLDAAEDLEAHSDRLKHYKVLMLATLIAVITLTLQIGGYIWFMATLNQRVSSTEIRLKAVESNYVQRSDVDRIDASRAKLEDARDRRLDRFEGKIDVLLENAARR